MDTPSDSATGTPRDGKHVVQVQILGHQLPIRGEADPSYILELAEFVDLKMREVTQKMPVAAVSKVAILASLNIADELFKERASTERDGTNQEDLAKRLNAVIHRLDQLIDETP